MLLKKNIAIKSIKIHEVMIRIDNVAKTKFTFVNNNL